MCSADLPIPSFGAETNGDSSSMSIPVKTMGFKNLGMRPYPGLCVSMRENYAAFISTI
jgi:hypothetical protein